MSAEQSPCDDALAVLSFYRFAPLTDMEALCDRLRRDCEARALRGTILLAPEGVNAALAGRREALKSLHALHFPNAEPKWSTAAPGNVVFDRLKVRVKPEIVTFGQSLAPEAAVGKRVCAKSWNALCRDPSVLVLDVRNGYESALGTFRGAKLAGTASFSEFRDFARRELKGQERRSLAMFCTGGIRCEKASAYLLEQGFETVYQLDGGILKYLAETAGDERLFDGECFVFDQRETVG